MLSEPKSFACDIPTFGQPDKTHRVVYYQWGDPSASRTAMCVHGLTRNGRDFDFLAQSLVSKGFQVICPDMPGRGKSPWLADPAGYNYPAYVADLSFLLQSLKLTNVDWVGTSMGGIIGMMMGNMAPGLLRSLVLNDIGTVVAAAGLKRIAEYVGQNAGHDTHEAAQANMRLRCASYGIKEEHHWLHLFTHGLFKHPDGKIRLTYDPAIALPFTTAKDIADVDFNGLWPALQNIPVLLIRGMQSDLLTEATARQMAATHPRLTLVEIEGAGHAPALMNGEQTSLVADWLLRA